MKRLIHTTMRHMRRTPFQALVATAVLTVAFFLISLFALVSAGSEQIIRYFESRPQVTAFFDDRSSEEAKAQLRTTFQGMVGVTSVRYISKEDALRLYQEQNASDPLLLEMVTADILPASLEVRASSPDILTQVADMMKNNEAIEEVVYHKSVIENLISWTRAVRVGGLTLVGFFVLSSVVTIIMIVGMKIANHKTEMEIMRLLGASRFHILAPFLLEGVAYGTAGAVTGWGLTYLVLLYSTPFILQFVGSIPLLPVPVWFMVVLLAALLVCGWLLGLFSSAVAARRFLK